MERPTHIMEAYFDLCNLERAKDEALVNVKLTDNIMAGALYAPTDGMDYRACEALAELGLIKRDHNAPMAAYWLVKK